MSNRVTVGMLEAQVSYLNRLMDAPQEPWTKGDDGKIRANIGNWHLSGAYGGYAVHCMSNESGGVTVMQNTGHLPKRDLLNRLRAFIAGIEAQKRKESESDNGH